MTTAISGTRRAIRELADGTIRVQIDVDPQFRREFLALFPEINMPIAIAPLQRDFDNEEKARAKGGELAKLAGRLCQNRDFQSYLAGKHGVTWVEASNKLCNGGYQDHAELSEAIAAESLRQILGIRSRAEIDSSDEASYVFQNIRKAFLEFQQK